MKSESYMDNTRNVLSVKTEVNFDELKMFNNEVIRQVIIKTSDKITESIMKEITPKLEKLFIE